MNKITQMEAIAAQVRDLEESPLYEFRVEHNYQPVIGEGDLNAGIVFIGEAPGKNEAESGRPFCGRAGKILDELLINAGLDRDEVYITNIVKDRPPNNRRPTKKEVELYSPFLLQQLEIIKPLIMVTLGSTATRFAFDYLNVEEDFSSFGEVVGRVFDVDVNDCQILIFPIYHPAYAIYQRTNLPKMREDFKRIPEILRNGKPSD